MDDKSSKVGSEIETAPEVQDTRRSILTALLGGIGITALSACVAKSDDPIDGPVGKVAQAVTSTDFACVDTVLGAIPPANRTGDLATNTPISVGIDSRLVVALGCITPGDGGGGIFYWDPTSSTGDDGGTIIVPSPGSVAGRWVRIYSGAVNVKWFGAKGDGSTPDQVAIQAAIVAIGATGGSVFFPAGTYMIASQILVSYDNISLEGVGHASCIKALQAIKDPNTYGMVCFHGPGLGPRLVNVGLRHLRISGFDEITDQAGPLVSFALTDGTFVEWCYLDTTNNEGLYWNGSGDSTNVRVIGNYATRVGGWGSSGSALAAYNIDADNVTMIGNRSFECGQAIEQGGSGGIIANNMFEKCGTHSGATSSWAMSIASTASAERLIVQGNTVKSANTGVICSSSGGVTIIADNVIESCNAGITVVNAGAEVVIRGNYIYDVFDGTQQGQAIQHASSAAVIIENNTVVAGPTAKWAYGVWIADGTSRTLVRNNIMIGDAFVGAVFLNTSTPANRNIEYIDNIVRPSSSGASLLENHLRYYWWDGPVTFSKLTLDGIDNGVILSTSRPSSVRNATAPTMGTWSVGDVCHSSNPLLASGDYCGWIYTSAGWKGFGLIA